MAINTFGTFPIEDTLRRVNTWIDGKAQTSFQPWPDGAYCPLNPEYADFRENGRVLVFWQEHAGFCLYAWEENGYNDSDWYMMVWDAVNKRPFPICFASTRGWTYPAYGSQPDATPEVLAEWEAYKANEEAKRIAANRSQKAAKLREQHKAELSLTSRYGFSLKALRAWRRQENPKNFDKAFRLLLSTKLRSDFKKSLQKQIADWLKAPKYKSPLSFRQWDYI